MITATDCIGQLLDLDPTIRGAAIGAFACIGLLTAMAALLLTSRAALNKVRSCRSIGDLIAMPTYVPAESSLMRPANYSAPVTLVEQRFEPRAKRGDAIPVRDAEALRETERRLQLLSHFDPLTGLANRAQLNCALQKMLMMTATSGATFAVYSIDIDRFKHINVLLGSECGDTLVIRAAHWLSGAIGADDFVARVGGDEFVVIQAHIASSTEAERFASHLASLFAEPVVLDGTTIKATVSIGIALAPTDGSTPDAILKSAGLAMRQAKRTRNAVKSFAPEMDETLRNRINLERRLADAISNGRFVLHYQPLFEINGTTLVGFEALIRLIGEDGVLISPASFIPVAEEIGLLGEIGSWALREACTTAATWPEPLSVAVNLSPTQFGNGSIARLVSRTLGESGLAPSRLELEITESLLLEDSDSIMAELRELKATGAKIVMDDFGTGYSSLSYLWKFPFDKLKVDRSFMTGFDGTGERVRTVLRTVIGLGRELNMRVTIEGVETAEQAAFLESVNGDQVQGYLYGVPMTSADVSILLAEHPARPSRSSSVAEENRALAVA